MLLAVLAAVLPLKGAAQPLPRPAEHEVKAAFLYQFGSYVDWPPDERAAGRPFLICVLGTDPFGPALDEIIEDKSISGRPLAVARLAELGEVPDCNVLFISRSEDDRLQEILASIQGRTVLTVGEGAQFTQRGGMVAFTIVDRRVRFIVNLSAARAANLSLSSRLLRVALRVVQ